MVKEPRAGRTKTRLARTLGAARAAFVYRAMMASLVARGMALAFLVLAAGAAAGLWAHWGEPGLRSIARGIFAIVLVELAMVAWRWPKQRPRRFRDRATRLLAVMATPSLHADYAESSPQVSTVPG